jgi:hypothetical protein
VKEENEKIKNKIKGRKNLGRPHAQGTRVCVSTTLDTIDIWTRRPERTYYNATRKIQWASMQSDDKKIKINIFITL